MNITLRRNLGSWDLYSTPTNKPGTKQNLIKDRMGKTYIEDT